ncbi:MAG: DUF535 family protein [Chitinophagaceae bacterium]|nr:DUF535 family protein [Chitinophagaceae bacterium]
MKNYKSNLTDTEVRFNNISSASLFKLAQESKQMASIAFANDSSKYRKKQENRSFFAALFNPHIARKWFGILKSPNFEQVAKYRNRLYFKPFRVYISTKWRSARKIKVILDTYLFILSKSDFLNDLITNKNGIELTRFYLNETIEGVLVLGYNDRYRKEGEIVLTFECEQLGGTIAAAAFSFEEIKKDEWVCRIGCIQGHSIQDENFSKITQKLLYGLRPKSLLVFTLQELSRQLGFSAIYGTGDAIQTYRKKHAIHLPWVHKIQFDYDAVWEESSGRKCNDGWYELPLVPSRKVIKELKTSKRAMYTRRYIFLDSLSLKIGETVSKINA